MSWIETTIELDALVVYKNQPGTKPSYNASHGNYLPGDDSELTFEVFLEVPRDAVKEVNGKWCMINITSLLTERQKNSIGEDIEI